MPGTVRLVFGVHCHQPTGNFDDVFQRALSDAYEPMIAALARHGSIKATLHYSGCLLEWLDRNAPDHLDRISTLARSGQVEMLTGGFYEPILSLIPLNDRLGQIRMQTRFIRSRFGVEPTGMWLAERIWEPSLPATLAAAGVRYTLLDDFHFLSSMDGDPVGGYYLTEEQGRTTCLLPISERLRYLIPFREPEETVGHLRKLAESPRDDRREPIAVMVDDGEKFGLWPGTREWVHGNPARGGWLERFFTELEKNSAWLKTCTPAEVMRDVEPAGRVYLPPGSYFEMGQWTLPPGRGRAYAAMVDRARSGADWDAERPFLRGGYFRNFLARYSESLLLTRRVQTQSALMDAADGESAAAQSGEPSEARRELWRATCNCGYWHGIFGGLYLPHIRRALGQHLCRSRRLFEEASGRAGRAMSRLTDLDADGRQVVEIDTRYFGLVLQPARGGALNVFDLKTRDFPLGLTLTRRIEAYHDAILAPSAPAAGSGESEHASIHDIPVMATEEMKGLVVADDRVRASLVDRFLKRGARVADLRRAAPVELGDFFDGPYAADLLSSPASFMRAGVVLRRSGLAAGRAVTLEKSLSAEAERPRIEVVYRLGDAGSGPLDMLFAVELNLALIETKGRLEITEESGPGRTVALSDETESAPATRVVVVEGHTGFEISFFIEPAAAVWHYPVRTVSRTEKGFEANYQGSALLFVWGGSGRMPDEMRLVIEAGEGRPDAVP